jgi:hypothetical protein
MGAPKLILILLLVAASAFGQGAAKVDNSTGGLVSPTAAQFKSANHIPDSAAWPLNAKTDFGAKGDGVTDDTAALQAGLNAAITQVRPLYIPAGTYKLSSALTEAGSVTGLTIYGDGSTQFSGGTTLLQNTASARILSFLTASDNMTIHDIAFAYAGTTGGGTATSSTASLLYFNGVGGNFNSAYIYNVVVLGGNNCIELDGFASSFFQNCAWQWPNSKAVIVSSGGNDNDLTFLTCSAILTVNGSIGYELDSGSNIVISGGDQVVTLAAPGNAILINMDGSQDVAVSGDFEPSTANVTGPLVRIQTQSMLYMHEMCMKGAAPSGYFFDTTASGELYFGAGCSSLASGAGHALVKSSFGNITNIWSSIPNVISVDYTSGATIVDTFFAQPFSTYSYSNGVAASGSNAGELFLVRNEGYVDDRFNLSAQILGPTVASGSLVNGTIYMVSGSGSISYNSATISAGSQFTAAIPTTYTVTGGAPVVTSLAWAYDNLDQYNSDVRAGIIPKTSVSNIWTAKQLGNSGWSTAVDGGSPVAATVGPGYFYDGTAGPVLNWVTSHGIRSQDDWGLFRSVSRGAPVYGTGTWPSLFELYEDAGANWHIGNHSTTDNSGTARLNIYGSINVGGSSGVSSGTNITRIRHGVATLSGGTIAVSDTSVTAVTRIFPAAQDNNTTGALRISARTPGTSFTITSSNGADSGVVAYEEVEP